MSEAANSNTSTSNGGGKQKESTDLTLKRVKKRNEELKPFADIIKHEKGEKNVREKKRIDHLMSNMIAAMIKFIGIQEISQKEILKTFKENTNDRTTRATNPKTSAEDKTKEAKTELRLQ